MPMLPMALPPFMQLLSLVTRLLLGNWLWRKVSTWSSESWWNLIQDTLLALLRFFLRAMPEKWMPPLQSLLHPLCVDMLALIDWNPDRIFLQDVQPCEVNPQM
jgi:hypothetical protein